jgi:hypothetical protein
MIRYNNETGKCDLTPNRGWSAIYNIN